MPNMQKFTHPSKLEVNFRRKHHQPCLGTCQILMKSQVLNSGLTTTTSDVLLERNMVTHASSPERLPQIEVSCAGEMRILSPHQTCTSLWRKNTHISFLRVDAESLGKGNTPSLRLCFLFRMVSAKHLKVIHRPITSWVQFGRSTSCLDCGAPQVV